MDSKNLRFEDHIRCPCCRERVITIAYMMENYDRKKDVYTIACRRCEFGIRIFDREGISEMRKVWCIMQERFEKYYKDIGYECTHDSITPDKTV
jgi:hypothetical protein